MLRSRLLWIGVAAAMVAVVAAGALHWWSRPRVLENGSVVTLVNARHLSLGDRYEVGVGTSGTLGLVANRCLAMFSQSGRPRVVVWPPGTTLEGSGHAVRVESQGHTVGLGDQVDGGTMLDNGFAPLRAHLPTACRRYPLDDFDPDG